MSKKCKRDTGSGIWCYSCCHWYYNTFRRLFSKDSEEQNITFVENPLKSPLIEKCNLCQVAVNPETVIKYHARDKHILVNESAILCDGCIQRLYYANPPIISIVVDNNNIGMRFAKL